MLSSRVKESGGMRAGVGMTAAAIFDSGRTMAMARLRLEGEALRARSWNSAATLLADAELARAL